MKFGFAHLLKRQTQLTAKIILFSTTEAKIVLQSRHVALTNRDVTTTVSKHGSTQLLVTHATQFKFRHGHGHDHGGREKLLFCCWRWCWWCCLFVFLPSFFLLFKYAYDLIVFIQTANGCVYWTTSERASDREIGCHLWRFCLRTCKGYTHTHTHTHTPSGLSCTDVEHQSNLKPAKVKE